MRHPRAWIACAAAALALGVCVAQGDPQAGVEALADRYQQSYNAGDLQAVADLFLTDAWLSEAGMAFEGRSAILDYLQQDDPPVEGATLEITVAAVIAPGEASVDVMGEDGPDVAVTAREGVAVARGSYALLDPEGRRLSGGKWLSANEWVDGEWRIRWLITNTEMPEGEGPP